MTVPIYCCPACPTDSIQMGQAIMAAIKKYSVSKRWRFVSLTIINRCIPEISNSSSIHNVPDHKLLHCLVLGNTTGTVCTSYRFHMASALLVAAVVPSLFRLRTEY